MKNQLITRLATLAKPFAHVNMIRVWLFGLSSGLTLLLTGNTLNFWLANLGLSLATLGLFSLVALPYALKYFIAPLVDNVRIPLLHHLGRRRSWILVAQLLLIISLEALGRTDPFTSITSTALMAVSVAFFAVIQDIAMDALRVDILTEEQRGPGSAVYIFGYRVGMLISGAGAIYMSSILTWAEVYHIMALLVASTMALIFLFTQRDRRPIHAPLTKTNKAPFMNRLTDFFTIPFQHLGNGKKFALIILFILLYRLPDNLIAIVINPFQLSLGFSIVEIATAAKFFGSAMAIVGGIIGGILIAQLGITRSLLWFGAIHLLSHGMFVIQAHIGYDLGFLYMLTATESLTGSMAMAAYIAYITSLCYGEKTGTQYALFSSIMGLSRTLIPASTGLVAECFGWSGLFIVITLLGLPALFMLIRNSHGH